MSEPSAEQDAGQLVTGARALSIRWNNVEDVPISFANTFAAQTIAAGEFIIVVGQVAPPLLVKPTPEQVAAIEAVQAQPIFRLMLSEQRLRELSELLQRLLARNRPTQDSEEEEEQS